MTVKLFQKKITAEGDTFQISKTVNVGHKSLFYGELMQIILSFVLDNAKVKRNSETLKEKSPIQV